MSITHHFSIEKHSTYATLTRFDPPFIRLVVLSKGYQFQTFRKLKDEYLKQATKVIQDPNILVNVISRRVKQLKHGSRPLVESLEKLNPEDIALREVIEGKITYQLYAGEETVIR